MGEEQNALQDPYFWVAIGSTLAALLAALFAWMIWRLGKRSLQLAERQDLHRRPNLFIYLADGYCKFKEASRFLAFSISVSNPSDVDNSIALAELQIDYTLLSSVCMAVKIPLAGNLAAQFGRPGLTVLVPPVRIDAHQTVAGWVIFELKNSLVGESRIDSYTLLIRDSHGTTVKLEHAIIRELADEEAKENN